MDNAAPTTMPQETKEVLESLNYFIGCKIIQAAPLSLAKFQSLFKNNNKIVNDMPGYIVRYPDGYTSWSPKEAFEKHYLGMGMVDADGKLHKNDRFITIDMLNNLIARFDGEGSDMALIQKMTTVFGFIDFEIVSNNNGPSFMDPEIAKMTTVTQLRNRLFKSLLFMEMWARNGLDAVQKLDENTDIEVVTDENGKTTVQDNSNKVRDIQEDPGSALKFVSDIDKSNDIQDGVVEKTDESAKIQPTPVDQDIKATENPVELIEGGQEPLTDTPDQH